MNETKSTPTEYDLSLEDEYDPFAGADDETEDEAEKMPDPEQEPDPFMPTFGDEGEAKAPVEKVDNRPAPERTADLLKRMHPRRKVLLGILDFCRNEQGAADVEIEVTRLQEHDGSVYDAASLCDLLETAGALERHGGEESEPETVVEDGIEYLQPVAASPVSWVTAEAGLGALEADRPMDRFHARMEEDAMYAPIYLKVLQTCSQEGGATAGQLGQAVDGDPLVQQPRLYAAYFFNNLAECDCLKWDGAWSITDLGRDAARELETAE